MADRNWKVHLSLILAALSFVAPIAFWWLDLQPYSLELKIVSSTSLQPSKGLPVDGLRVVLAGKPIVDPYVSVLVLSNDGRRPVTADAFESPMVIDGGSQVRISRAQVVEKTPSSISPKVDLRAGTLVLQPLLLNPGDSIGLAVVTENGAPDFRIRSRISGVNDVFVNREVSRRQKQSVWIVLSVSVLLALLTGAMIRGFKQALEGGHARPRSWLMATVGVVGAGASGALFSASVEYFSIWLSDWPKLFLLAAAPFPLMVIGYLFSRKAYVPRSISDVLIGNSKRPAGASAFL